MFLWIGIPVDISGDFAYCVSLELRRSTREPDARAGHPLPVSTRCACATRGSGGNVDAIPFRWCLTENPEVLSFATPLAWLLKQACFHPI
jgi:hypothetical protein